MATKVKEVKISAVIPTVQYGNISPEFTLEGGTDKAMKKKGLELIQEVWDEYGSAPLNKNEEKPMTEGVEFEEVLSFTGEKVLWSDYLHEYRSLDGVKLTSGSAYASMLEKPFDAALLSEKSGNAWGVDKDELASLWKFNGKIATDYGTTIHQALETYMRFHKLGAVVQEKKGLEYNYALPKNDYLRKIVMDFVELFGSEGLPEVFVTDVKNKMAGQIDLLQIIDLEKKVCRLQDYKTNFEMKKAKLKYYSHQLSFYGLALKNHGWTVEGYDIFHLNGDKWNKYEVDEQDIDTKLFQ